MKREKRLQHNRDEHVVLFDFHAVVIECSILFLLKEFCLKM